MDFWYFTINLLSSSLRSEKASSIPSAVSEKRIRLRRDLSSLLSLWYLLFLLFGTFWSIYLLRWITQAWRGISWSFSLIAEIIPFLRSNTIPRKGYLIVSFSSIMNLYTEWSSSDFVITKWTISWVPISKASSSVCSTPDIFMLFPSMLRMPDQWGFSSFATVMVLLHRLPALMTIFQSVGGDSET